MRWCWVLWLMGCAGGGQATPQRPTEQPPASALVAGDGRGQDARVSGSGTSVAPGMSGSVGAALATAAGDRGVPSSAALSGEADYPLFRRYPALAERLPRLSLTTLPTPVERALAIEPGHGVRIYIKRDDASAQLYGGGKPRKLELLLAEAQRLGANRLITVGGVGSHHALATSLFARQLGMASTVYLLPQPPSDEVRHNLLSLLATGADMRRAGSYAGARAAARRQQAQSPAGDTLFIEAGGTSARSTIAFVSAGIELAEQVRAGVMPLPDEVYVAMGTMGSAVGLALGFAAAGLPTKVVAVRVSNRGTSSRAQALALAQATISELRRLWPPFPQLTLSREQFVIEGGYLGGGYGVATARGRKARLFVANKLSLALEDTYTAKTVGAMLDVARRRHGRGERAVLLYWHSHDGGVRQLSGSATVADLAVPFRAYFPRGSPVDRK